MRCWHKRIVITSECRSVLDFKWREALCDHRMSGSPRATFPHAQGRSEPIPLRQAPHSLQITVSMLCTLRCPYHPQVGLRMPAPPYPPHASTGSDDSREPTGVSTDADADAARSPRHNDCADASLTCYPLRLSSPPHASAASKGPHHLGPAGPANAVVRRGCACLSIRQHHKGLQWWCGAQRI